MDDLLQRLRKIETGDGTGDHVTHWYRNPDGVEAAEEIVKLKWRAKIDANIIARMRLTEEELEAVENAVILRQCDAKWEEDKNGMADNARARKAKREAETLLKLLERMK